MLAYVEAFIRLSESGVRSSEPLACLIQKMSLETDMVSPVFDIITRDKRTEKYQRAHQRDPDQAQRRDVKSLDN